MIKSEWAGWAGINWEGLDINPNMVLSTRLLGYQPEMWLYQLVGLDINRDMVLSTR
ncbi:hypothetical protein [Virgibacillus sp. L01]|uniref:hypothetical protein n=1 Tax=Virgibacillus sp. L01 TaxID=3457429 RepID=UPI003FD34186